MADNNDAYEGEKPEGTETPAPEDDIGKPRRKRKPLQIDPSQIVEYLITNFHDYLTVRNETISARKERWCKLHGWLPRQQDAEHEYWLPIMMTASMRTRAALENAVKSVRPMMNSQSLKKIDRSKQDHNDQLLDYQFFVENRGEPKLDDWISNFVDDEVAFGFVHYVKEEQTIHDVRVLPSLNPNIPVEAQFLIAIQKRLFTGVINAVMKGDAGWTWEVDFKDGDEICKAIVEFYETDDLKVEAVIIREVCTFDGPCFEVLDYEDVIYPPRAANLQPPSQSNPNGAPIVFRNCKSSMDAIKRMKDEGIFDLLTDDDIEVLEGGRSDTSSGSDTDRPKEEKDKLSGMNAGVATINYEDRQIIEAYFGCDVDGDGFEEQAIAWIADPFGTRKLCSVRLLSERYPGTPLKRPIVHDSIFPIPNRVAGQGLPELLEPIQDLTLQLLEQHIDWGEITNSPFFFYRASSSIRPEPIELEPGMGYPMDNPQTDVFFPQWPTKDSSYSLNTMTVLQQFAERLQMFSDVSFGRVPTGKASALRTLGTTASLLAQGDVRSEQILRRLFHSMSDVFLLMHRLNRRFLPETKEIKAVGADELEGGYTTVKQQDIDYDIDHFEFKATMLNANKAQLADNLRQVGALLISPLAVQAGVVTMEEIYKLMRDMVKALYDDGAKYMRPPPPGIDLPMLTAEDVVTIIVNNGIPQGKPAEAPPDHLAKLEAATKAELFVLLTPEQQMVWQAWVARVQMLIAQQQQMMAAVGQMQQTLGGGGGQGGQGPGGAPTTMGQNPGAAQNPMVNSGEHIDETQNPGGLAQ